VRLTFRQYLAHFKQRRIAGEVIVGLEDFLKLKRRSFEQIERFVKRQLNFEEM
jgi:hypothetical protein